MDAAEDLVKGTVRGKGACVGEGHVGCTGTGSLVELELVDDAFLCASNKTGRALFLFKKVWKEKDRNLPLLD